MTLKQMPAGAIPIAARRQGVYVVLQACLPGLPEHAAGVLLVDPATDKGYFRLRSRFDDLDEDTEFWDDLARDVEDRVREYGAEEYLRRLEDCLSNVLRVGERHSVEVDSFTRVLDRLFREQVEPVAVERYRTHVPLYTLRAAAGYLSDEIAPEESDLVPLPAWRRPSDRLFAAVVDGPSMEPLIPDGSLNLFSSDLQGSRQGKVVLIERFGVSDEAQRYSVKRYQSRKIARGEDQWEHGSITFVPQNPDFEPWSPQPDEFRILAEWLGVIE
ncbi:MAG: S24 family peptidase [Gemmataceae bacterium]|nr:S24 family peptidase [Gemmataceae bacterium]